MLRSCRKLIEYQVHSKDGPVGQLYDLYFDDRSKKIICAVVGIGKSRRGLRVLISPNFLGAANHDMKLLPVNLSRNEVTSAPEWDLMKPVYRQRTVDLGLNYLAPSFAGSVGVGVVGRSPPPSKPGSRPELGDAQEPEIHEHVRSFREISGYDVLGSDGRLGEFADFVLGDDEWRFRYMVVETEDGDCQRSLLIPTSSIRYISWDDQMILTDISNKLLRSTPYFAATRS